MNHNPLRGRPHLPSISTELAISILVVCFYVVFSLITPTFSSEYNLINLLKQASVKGIVTIAVTFVFIAGQCDLTVGASTALSAMICALLMSDHGWSPWSAIAVSVLCTLLVGVINGFIVYELKVVPFIATLGMLIIAFFLSQIHLPWLLWFAQLNQNRFAMYATGLVTPSILLLLTQP